MTYVRANTLLLTIVFVLRAGQIRCSRLGELLDIVADNVARACAWFALALVQPMVAPLAIFIVSVEWCTMLATQFAAVLDGGKHWKQQRAQDPWLIRFFFSNNFFNPLGVAGIAGLFFTPLAWYLAATMGFSETWYGMTLLVWLSLGRSLSLSIELYFIWNLVKVMLVPSRTHND